MANTVGFSRVSQCRLHRALSPVIPPMRLFPAQISGLPSPVFPVSPPSADVRPYASVPIRLPKEQSRALRFYTKIDKSLAIPAKSKSFSATHVVLQPYEAAE